MLRSKRLPEAILTCYSFPCYQPLHFFTCAGHTCSSGTAFVCMHLPTFNLLVHSWYQHYRTPSCHPNPSCVLYTGLARAIHIYIYIYVFTVYLRCIHGMLSRKITIHTVIYGVHIWFWPTLTIHKCTYLSIEARTLMVMAYTVRG